MEKSGVKEQFLKNSIWNLFSNITIKLGGLVFAVILARFLLPEKFGIYGLAMSISILFLTFADFGVNQALARYVSYAVGKKNPHLSRNYYKYLLKIKVLSSIFFSTLLLFLAYPLAIYFFNKPLLFIPLLIISLYLLLESIGKFYQYLFYANKKIKPLTIKELLFQTARILLVLFVFIFLSSKYHLNMVFFSLILSTLISLAYLILYLKKSSFFVFEKSKPLKKNLKSKVWRFIIYALAGDISAKLFANIDLIMIGFFLSSEFVGYYNAAFVIVVGLASFLSIDTILLPVFTQMKKQKISEAFNEVVRYLFIISFPIIFGLLILGKYVIRAIYGIDYLPAVFPLYPLTILIFVIPLTVMLKTLFFANEKPNYLLKPTIFTSIFKIVLTYFLIILLLQDFNSLIILVVALITVISRLILVCYLLIICTKKLKIKIKFKNAVKPFFSSLIMGAILLVLFSRIEDMNLSFGILEVFIGAGAYFLIMIFLKGIEKKDILLFKGVLKKSLIAKNLKEDYNTFKNGKGFINTTTQ